MVVTSNAFRANSSCAVVLGTGPFGEKALDSAQPALMQRDLYALVWFMKIVSMCCH